MLHDSLVRMHAFLFNFTIEVIAGFGLLVDKTDAGNIGMRFFHLTQKPLSGKIESYQEDESHKWWSIQERNKRNLQWTKPTKLQ